MLNFFMAGPDLVSWDLTALGPQGDGPFRLVVHHAAGSITEHFDTVTGALIRQGQLEALLLAARGAADTYDVKPLPVPESNPALPKKTHTILVIDDDQTVTETFATALHREGFNVRTAMNAENGLREATSSHADAIILDLRMPLINGIGFLYRLRNWDEHRFTPVAIVTGAVVDDSTQAELSELGAELRFKPLWLEDVVELAHQLVARAA
ncbi:MAG TPA: response regulator [Vicinamibacterales bacterium]|jgi:CheY-like chemotaxis protein